MATVPPVRGAVLDPTAAARAFTLVRLAPDPALAPFVRHYWFLRWDLGAATHTQDTLPLPGVNAVLEGPRDTVSGVATRRFVRVLEGRGAVFGALFHAAGFGPFFRRPLHLLTDRSVPFAEAFGGGFTLAPDADDTHARAAWDRFLLARLPPRDPEADGVQALVDRIAADPALGRAEALAEAEGVSLRTLQRAFRHHVGVGPKQVIRRYRLLEAAHRLHSGAPVDQASLAFALGYADQSHLVRDFRAAIGRPPARYAAAQPVTRRT